MQRPLGVCCLHLDVLVGVAGDELASMSAASAFRTERAVWSTADSSAICARRRGCSPPRARIKSLSIARTGFGAEVV